MYMTEEGRERNRLLWDKKKKLYQDCQEFRQKSVY